MFESIARKEMDEFVDIIGYEGYYQINRLGQVRNIKKKIHMTMKQYEMPHGYFRILLSKNNTPKDYLIHRLVAIQFIPNPENKPTVDHIDRNRENNSVTNLRWATHSEQKNNTSRSAIVRGTTTQALKKISNRKANLKFNTWQTISNQFRKILLE
jgi:hypothetical protein